MVPDLEALLLEPDAVSVFKQKDVTYAEYETRVRKLTRVTNVYGRSNRAPDGNLADLTLIVGVAEWRPAEIRNVIMRELVFRMLGEARASNVIRPSLVNTGNQGVREAFDFVEKYRRLPLIDYLVFQATAVVASRPEEDWPETSTDLAEIVAGLMTLPEMPQFPPDLYKSYRAP